MSIELTIGVPVHNEAEVLPKLHQLITACCADLQMTYEILFVDDGSRDQSSAILHELAASDPRVSVVTLSRNFGHPAALAAAVELARGRSLILMDADLQDDPGVIPELVRVHRQEDAEVVYVVRGKRREKLPVRMLFSGFHWLLARSSTYPVPQDSGSFGLLGPKALADVRRFTERLRYFPGMRAFVGHTQRAVVSDRGARYDETSRVGLRGLVRLAGLALFSQSRLPVTLFYWLAGFSLTVAIGLVLYAFISRFLGYAVVSWASAITSIAFFGSITTLGQAFICEYLARIYEEIRGRPIYITERIVWGGTAEGDK